MFAMSLLLCGKILVVARRCLGRHCLGLPGEVEMFVVAFELSEDVQMQPYNSFERHIGLDEDVNSIIVA